MIYLDHAATTPLRPEALEAMLPFFRESYGNPSAAYGVGREARRAVSEARRAIASSLSVGPDEIYFTSGGTEADNWALIAAFEAARAEGRSGRIVSSAIEHHAVLETLRYLREERGAQVELLPADENGVIRPEALASALEEDCCLVSVMTANNEVGTIQPVERLAGLAHASGALFHTDAVQAYGHMPMAEIASCVDLLSASAHKFGGPKGAGFLMIRRGLPLRALLRGGAQERQRRAGTENVPGIVGMGRAAAAAAAQLDAQMKRERELRDLLYCRLQEGLPEVMLNGDADRRLSNNLNLYFPGVRAETALIMLDQAGVAAGAGAACASGALEPSHVLTAMGFSAERANSSLRFTVGADNTEAEIEAAAERMACVAAALRRA